ncbi:MAG TPA: class I SAM-dependent methyltransferase [Candidatus Eremiobacteraceae bacterium]|jgi:SAM-dependent methyltransferase
MWTDAEAYDAYIGRWSRIAAEMFVDWLGVAPRSAWLDVGCGTGALSQAIIARTAPTRVLGIDKSQAFAARAKSLISDDRFSVNTGDASRLAMPDGSFDAVVSGLMLNAVPDQRGTLSEFVRVTRPGGVVATYLWDYDGEMQVLRYFWKAAKALDPAADALSDIDEAYAICKPDRLKSTFVEVGLDSVEVRALDVPAHFRDFDDYWAPLQRGHAPSQEHVASLSDVEKVRLKDHLRAILPANPDGSIDLLARAWAAKGARPPT